MACKKPRFLTNFLLKFRMMSLRCVWGRRVLDDKMDKEEWARKIIAGIARGDYEGILFEGDPNNLKCRAIIYLLGASPEALHSMGYRLKECRANIPDGHLEDFVNRWREKICSKKINGFALVDAHKVPDARKQITEMSLTPYAIFVRD